MQKLIGAEGATMPPSSQAAAPAAAPTDVRPRLIPGSDETSGEVAASPEEENILQQVVAKAMMMIHGQKARDPLLKALHNPREPVPAVVGRTAANILMAISDQKAAATNDPVDREILKEAAGYVIPELLDVGMASGIFPQIEGAPQEGGEVGAGGTAYDEQVKLALLEAVKAYGEAQLKKPGAEAEVQRAGDEWARGVAEEVHAGTADPEYMKMARPDALVQGGA